jgi:hypothetical protein
MIKYEVPHTIFSARLRRLLPLILVLISAAIAVAGYLQALNYPFISDDIRYITENTKLAELPLPQLWRLFTEPYNAFAEFLPLRDLTYWLELTLFGLNPTAFRMTNIVLYLLCLPLVFATTLEFWRYFRPTDTPSAPWAAAVVTALFALHPTLVESVVWISGLKYVLPNLFAMLALWFAVRARNAQGLSASRAAAALVAFVAMMLSKASYFALAPVIAMLWVIFWLDIKAPGRRRSQLLWPLTILILAGLLVLVFISASTGTEPAYFGIEAGLRTLAVLGWMGRLAVSPESRHFLYPVFEDQNLPVMVALGGAILATTAIGAVMFLRRRSIEGFSLIAFLMLCIPYMQLVPYAAPSLVSDRFLSLALWPVMLLIVALAWRLNPVPRVILLLAFALPLSFQSISRIPDWRSLDSLVDVDIRAYPGFFMPAYFKICIQSLDTPESYDRVIRMADNITDHAAKDIIVSMIKSDRAVFSAASIGDPSDAMAHLKDVEFKLGHPPAEINWNTPINNLWNDSQEKLLFLWKHLMDNFPGNELVHYNALSHQRNTDNE